MTDEPITLAFIARQLDRVLDRLGVVEDKLEMLGGREIRHDGTAQDAASGAACMINRDRSPPGSTPSPPDSEQGTIAPPARRAFTCETSGAGD
jgi:hypothetical protein